MLVDTSIKKPTTLANKGVILKRTTHAMRRGATEVLNEHPKINTTRAIQRGGWAAECINKVFTYIDGTIKSDGETGLFCRTGLMSKGGGLCPGIFLFRKKIEGYFNNMYMNYYQRSIFMISILNILWCAYYCSTLKHYTDIPYTNLIFCEQKC